MRAYWISIDAEERDRDKGPVASETQDSIAQFERSMMFFRIVLMKVDVYMPHVQGGRTSARVRNDLHGMIR